MARFLALKSTGKLGETLKNIVQFVLPEKYDEQIQTVLSAGRVQKTVGKGYGGVKQAHLENPPDWFRKISGFKSICD